MGVFFVAKDYLVWHYSTAYVDILHVWWNYLWFVNHLFSVPDVLKTLFAPWKRLQEEKVSILIDPEGFFGNLFVNLIMRLVGIVIRLALLLIALCCFLIVVIGGLMLLMAWTLLPVIIANLFTSSVSLLVA